MLTVVLFLSLGYVVFFEGFLQKKVSGICVVAKQHFIAEGNFVSVNDLMFRKERFIEKTANFVSKLTVFLVPSTGVEPMTTP